MNTVLLVLSNFGDLEEARRVGRTLVEEGMVACVNVMPGVESIYRWKGEIETAAEVALWMKTTEAAYPKLEQRLKSLHSYELPEIIAFPVAAGLPDYLQWVAAQVS